MKTKANYVLARKSAYSQDFELTDKLTAHIQGWQHYAFSIFIFNSKQELLLQKRAEGKYHSPGLWTNTCCSHPLSPQLNEIEETAKERLAEEMGIRCSLNFIFRFEYHASCGELIENEIDYVFFGLSNEKPTINPLEVSEYKYVKLADLRKGIIKNPGEYTEWLKIIMDEHYESISDAFLRLSSC